MRLILLALACLLNVSCNSKDSRLSLCKNHEVEVFNCQIEHKLLSLCASNNTENKDRLFQYKFGNNSNIELRYPEKPAAPSAHFMLSSTAYSGGGELRLRFRNKDYDYILFERTIRTGFDEDGNKPEFSAGLIIKRSGKIKSVKKCSNNNALIIIPEDIRIPEEEFDDSIVIE